MLLGIAAVFHTPFRGFGWTLDGRPVHLSFAGNEPVERESKPGMDDQQFPDLRHGNAILPGRDSGFGDTAQFSQLALGEFVSASKLDEPCTDIHSWMKS